MKRTILVALAVSLCYVASAQIIPFDQAVRTCKQANGFNIVLLQRTVGTGYMKLRAIMIWTYWLPWVNWEGNSGYNF